MNPQQTADYHTYLQGAGLMPSQSEHTPGPWQLKYTEDGKEFTGLVVAPGTVIANTEAAYWHNLAASASGYSLERFQENGTQCEANARLIAAAPDLLALLERIADEPCDHGAMLFCPREEAREAIAKVRGS